MLLKSVFTKNIKGFCRVIVLIVDVVTAEFVYRVNKKMIFARVIFVFKDKSQRKHHEKFMFCIPFPAKSGQFSQVKCSFINNTSIKISYSSITLTLIYRPSKQKLHYKFLFSPTADNGNTLQICQL